MCPNREVMAQPSPTPSIESLLKLAPEESDSWVLGSNPNVNRIARQLWVRYMALNAFYFESGAQRSAPQKYGGVNCSDITPTTVKA